MSERHGSFINLTRLKKYWETALAIREIGNIEGKAVNCGRLGTQFFHLAVNGRAEKYIRKRLQSRKR